MALIDGDISAQIKIPCALTELPLAVGLITDATASLQASATASVDVFTAVGVP